MDSRNIKNKLKLKEKLLLKRVGQAIRDYDMIRPGDRICIGVSGGQDSLTLLALLSSRTLLVSLKYSLHALHVENNFVYLRENSRLRLEVMLKERGVPCTFIRDASGGYSEGGANCFWCAWNRRKAMFEEAEKLGCNKIALGHHKDDVIETTLLNLFYNGEISTMNPKQVLFGGKLTIIRPLSYLEKKDITGFAGVAGFPAESCLCPGVNFSKRRTVRDLISRLAGTSRSVKSNIFRAPSRIRDEYLGKAEACSDNVKAV
ncbi:MAG: ATP-binding protein [Candidatus Omnitrophota bacterium]